MRNFSQLRIFHAATFYNHIISEIHSVPIYKFGKTNDATIYMPKVVLCVRDGVHFLGINRGIRLTMAEISKSIFSKSLFEHEQ